MKTDAIEAYLSQMHGVLDQLPKVDIQSMIAVLRYARVNNRQVFILGNGGSAATASHFACDLSKGTIREGRPRFRVIALTDNMPLFSAWANDTGYEHVFSQQLTNLGRPGDIVIAISGSGNSPNVLHAIRQGRSMGAITIGLTGFDGGKLRDLVDLSVVVPCDCIQQVEDAHMILEHLICSVLDQDEVIEVEPTWSAFSPTGFPRKGGNRRAVFLGHDGVIAEGIAGHIKAQEGSFPGVFEALRVLAASQLAIVVITNQSAVDRGVVGQALEEEINRRMAEKVRRGGGRVDKVVFRLQQSDGDWQSRKPKYGLLMEAAEALDIYLPGSYVVGDSFDDLAAGRAVGCRGALILTGRGLRELRDNGHSDAGGFFLTPNVLSAATWVLEQEGERA